MVFSLNIMPNNNSQALIHIVSSSNVNISGIQTKKVNGEKNKRNIHRQQLNKHGLQKNKSVRRLLQVLEEKQQQQKMKKRNQQIQFNKQNNQSIIDMFQNDQEFKISNLLLHELYFNPPQKKQISLQINVKIEKLKQQFKQKKVSKIFLISFLQQLQKIKQEKQIIVKKYQTQLSKKKIKKSQKAILKKSFQSSIVEIDNRILKINAQKNICIEKRKQFKEKVQSFLVSVKAKIKKINVRSEQQLLASRAYHQDEFQHQQLSFQEPSSEQRPLKRESFTQVLHPLEQQKLKNINIQLIQGWTKRMNQIQLQTQHFKKVSLEQCTFYLQQISKLQTVSNPSYNQIINHFQQSYLRTCIPYAFPTISQIKSPKFFSLSLLWERFASHQKEFSSFECKSLEFSLLRAVKVQWDIKNKHLLLQIYQKYCISRNLQFLFENQKLLFQIVGPQKKTIKSSQQKSPVSPSVFSYNIQKIAQKSPKYSISQLTSIIESIYGLLTEIQEPIYLLKSCQKWKIILQDLPMDSKGYYKQELNTKLQKQYIEAMVILNRFYSEKCQQQSISAFENQIWNKIPRRIPEKLEQINQYFEEWKDLLKYQIKQKSLNNEMWCGQLRMFITHWQKLHAIPFSRLQKQMYFLQDLFEVACLETKIMYWCSLNPRRNHMLLSIEETPMAKLSFKGAEGKVSPDGKMFKLINPIVSPRSFFLNRSQLQREISRLVRIVLRMNEMKALLSLYSCKQIQIAFSMLPNFLQVGWIRMHRIFRMLNILERYFFQICRWQYGFAHNSYVPRPNDLTTDPSITYSLHSRKLHYQTGDICIFKEWIVKVMNEGYNARIIILATKQEKQSSAVQQCAKGFVKSILTVQTFHRRPRISIPISNIVNNAQIQRAITDVRAKIIALLMVHKPIQKKICQEIYGIIVDKNPPFKTSLEMKLTVMENIYESKCENQFNQKLPFRLRQTDILLKEPNKYADGQNYQTKGHTFIVMGGGKYARSMTALESSKDKDKEYQPPHNRMVFQKTLSSSPIISLKQQIQKMLQIIKITTMDQDKLFLSQEQCQEMFNFLNKKKSRPYRPHEQMLSYLEDIYSFLCRKKSYCNILFPRVRPTDIYFQLKHSNTFDVAIKSRFHQYKQQKIKLNMQKEIQQQFLQFTRQRDLLTSEWTIIDKNYKRKKLKKYPQQSEYLQKYLTLLPQDLFKEINIKQCIYKISDRELIVWSGKKWNKVALIPEQYQNCLFQIKKITPIVSTVYSYQQIICYIDTKIVLQLK